MTEPRAQDPAGRAGPQRGPGGTGAGWPTATTRPVVLLGWPARHSRSPVLHNAAFAADGLDLVYLAWPTPPERLEAAVAALGAAGARGANVTVPHKLAVRALCDRVTDEAAAVGAVNTLVWDDDGALTGDNSDARGLAHALVAAGAVEAGTGWTVLGTGGSARAVAVAAGRLGCPVTVVGRRRDAADEVAASARRAGAPTATAIDVADEPAVVAAVADARTVLNATPLGMHGEALPSAFHQLVPGQDAYDLVYGAAHAPATPFLIAAAAAGAGAHDGLSMLIGQAAVSYTAWTGRPAPTSTMRAAVEG